MASDTEILRLTSSGSKSVVVLPSSTRPRRLIAPVHSSNDSVSVVFPEPPWPTSATLRIFSGGKLFTRAAPWVLGSGQRSEGWWYREVRPIADLGYRNLFDGRWREGLEKGL